MGRLADVTTRLSAASLLTAAAIVSSVLPMAAASADSARPSISHVESTDRGFSVVLDVPDGSTPDLAGVLATVDGTAYPASATTASAQSQVRRSAVLAIDTSDSMRGARFAAARSAAGAFLDGVPDNVAVGIVSFSAAVDEALAPTLDRDAARAVLSRLRLSQGTRLYDGIQDAVDLSGTGGSRTVVVLSDGADTGSDVSLPDVARAVRSDGVSVDVVALDSAGDASLRSLGDVVPATDGALARTFAAEAAILRRQVAVDISVPSGDLVDLAGRTVSIDVTLPTTTGDLTGDLTGEAAVPIAARAAPPTTIAAPPARSASASPTWLKYAGAGLVGVGLLVVLLLLAPRGSAQVTPAQRVTAYTAATRVGEGAVERRESGDDALVQAKQAAASVLRRNRSLDVRITQRLDSAGSRLKSSEWLLVHLGAFVLAGVVGLLIGRGNLVGLIFLLLGAVGPWVYLGARGSARRRAFNAALPDTLQLMSGSLSAGLSLAQSVDTIVREGAEPVASEFRRVLVEARLGVSLEDAFDGVALRFESKDFQWVVMAIRIQREVGGNLAELLDTVAATMREREYLRRQVNTLAAEGKLSAIVIGALPPLFLLYLLATDRSYVMPLFTDPKGIVMLIAAGVLLGLGIFTMAKLVKVEV